MLMLLHVFVVIASFQLSGIVHFAIDFAQSVTVGHLHDATETDENDPNHDCPPGCPSCHHVHVSGASIPTANAMDLACLAVDTTCTCPERTTDDAPAGPHLPLVYRPPRA